MVISFSVSIFWLTKLVKLLNAILKLHIEGRMREVKATKKEAARAAFVFTVQMVLPAMLFGPLVLAFMLWLTDLPRQLSLLILYQSTFFLLLWIGLIVYGGRYTDIRKSPTCAEVEAKERAKLIALLDKYPDMRSQ